MQFFKHTAEGKTISLYPIVCMHVGANQCDEDFIKEHVKRIAADPNGRYIYLGDGGECVTKASKGEIYCQRLSPDEQIDRVVALLDPIRGRGLFGVSGNHDRRIAKLSGLDWTNALCTKLGIPYLGISAFMHLILPVNNNITLAWDLFWHHGADSSAILGTKVNKAKKLEELVEADVVFSAHSHIALEVPPTYKAFIEKRSGIKYREIRNFICGCAYDSRVPGYAEEKAYSPILPAYLGVTFSAKNKGSGNERTRVKHVECEIWRATP